MARPRKQTVDYFPHYCFHKKTMFILEQRYGNNGYAFWFKLLERLGRNEGHVINLSDEVDLEFLAAETRLSAGLTLEILDLLARLDAIDKSLWQEKHIIWSQNFVDNIADAYKDRKVNLPTKPVYPPINEVSPPINEVNLSKSGEKSANEMKLDETKVNNKKNTHTHTFIPDNFSISEDVRRWAINKGYEPYLEDYLSWFVDYAKAGGIKQIDWDAKFRNAIRGDWGNIRKNGKAPPGKNKINNTLQNLVDFNLEEDAREARKFQ